MYERIVVEVTTDGSGDAVAVSEPYTGIITAISYIKTDFATGVDFAIVGQDTGQGIWTELNVDASTIRYPRAAVHAAATGTAISGGYSPIILLNERVQITIAQGGAAKTGRFEILVADAD